MSVHFRPVTMENLKDVYLLEVGPGQDGLVAPVGYSIAQAHISDEELHYRAIYDDDTAVGFLLWDIQPPGSRFPGWGLGRLLIDHRYQGRGYGTAAIDLLCAEIRSSSQHPQCLWTSYEPRADGPREFYAKYGFEPTGDVDDGEEVALLRHWKDGTPTDDPFA
jgi:diamine N-acetyltransferase